MPIGFSKLLTDALVALGDPNANTWSRVDVIWPWCNEAMLEFPILRPRQAEILLLVDGHDLTLPTDFREIISVEYPIDLDPPKLLARGNRLDSDFYDHDNLYDVDRDYLNGTGWLLTMSALIPDNIEVRVNYLGNHKTDCIDDDESYITVEDEYEPILVAYVVAKGYRERLGHYMQDPTAHTSIIAQMTDMCQHAEERYADLLAKAQIKISTSRTSQRMSSDKYDRVY